MNHDIETLEQAAKRGGADILLFPSGRRVRPAMRQPRIELVNGRLRLNGRFSTYEEATRYVETYGRSRTA